MSNNPNLIYLFAAGNGLTSIDVSHNPYLMGLYVSNNKLKTIDISQNTYLQTLVIRRNSFDFATLPTPDSNWIEYDYIQNNMPVDRSTCSLLPTRSSANMPIMARPMSAMKYAEKPSSQRRCWLPGTGTPIRKFPAAAQSWP